MSTAVPPGPSCGKEETEGTMDERPSMPPRSLLSKETLAAKVQGSEQRLGDLETAVYDRLDFAKDLDERTQARVSLEAFDGLAKPARVALRLGGEGQLKRNHTCGVDGVCEPYLEHGRVLGPNEPERDCRINVQLLSLPPEDFPLRSCWQVPLNYLRSGETRTGPLVGFNFTEDREGEPIVEQMVEDPRFEGPNWPPLPFRFRCSYDRERCTVTFDEEHETFQGVDHGALTLEYRRAAEAVHRRLLAAVEEGGYVEVLREHVRDILWDRTGDGYESTVAHIRATYPYAL